VDDTIFPVDLVATGWPLVLLGAAALALVLTVLVALSTLKDLRSPLAVLVGATAGFQTAQIASVHIFAPAVLLWLVFGVWREPRGRWHPKWALVVVAAVVLLASTALTGQMVNSKLVAIQLVLLAGTGACLVAFGDQEDARSALHGLLMITTVACVAALAQYVGVLPYKIYLGTHRPIGLYSEPDWLGMFSAVGLLLAFRATNLGRWRTPLVFLHVIVLLLAAARAAWIAVVVVAALGWVVARLARKSGSVPAGPKLGGWRMAVGGVLVVIVALMVSPSLRESLTDRVTGAVGSRPEVGAMARQKQNASLLELNSQAPPVGLGLSASGRVGVSGRIAYMGNSVNNVASNWLLGWWVDGGVLSLPLIGLFFFAAARRLTVTHGLLLGVVLACSFFSNAMVIPIAWFALALCLIEPARAPEPAPVGPPNPPVRAGVAVTAG